MYLAGDISSTCDSGLSQCSALSLSFRQVDVNTKNVFGQPRLRASLRDLRSPRKNYKSTIEDDLKRLIIMDNTGPEQEQECTVRHRIYLASHAAVLPSTKFL